MVENAVPKHASNLEITEMADGIVIQRDDLIHTLNTTSREIFYLCDGSRTVGEIIQEIEQQYSGENIGSTIKELIASFLTLNLIHI